MQFTTELVATDPQMHPLLQEYKLKMQGIKVMIELKDVYTCILIGSSQFQRHSQL